MTPAEHAATVRDLTAAIEHWVREQTTPLSTPESRTEAKRKGRAALAALQAQAARVAELEAALRDGERIASQYLDTGRGDLDGWADRARAALATDKEQA